MTALTMVYNYASIALATARLLKGGKKPHLSKEACLQIVSDINLVSGEDLMMMGVDCKNHKNREFFLRNAVVRFADAINSTADTSVKLYCLMGQFSCFGLLNERVACFRVMNKMLTLDPQVRLRLFNPRIYERIKINAPAKIRNITLQNFNTATVRNAAIQRLIIAAQPKKKNIVDEMLDDAVVWCKTTVKSIGSFLNDEINRKSGK